MFEKLIQWVKEILKKMIGRTTIQQALSAEVAVSDTMLTAIGNWAKIYENKADWLNEYVKSLNLGAAIAAEIARSATMEMILTIEGSARAKYLQAEMEKVMNRLREELERGCAKGGLVMKPYVDGDHINIDFVQADQFFPIRFDNNGNITACVFVDQRKIGDANYTRLEYHDLTDAGYLVRNQAYKSSTRDALGQQIPLAMIEDWAGLAPEATITAIEKPLYGYFRFPLANNIDATSPVGVSCYSRAVELIQAADTQWSDLLWEFESGKRALYVDVQAFSKDSSGRPVLPNKRLYKTLDMGGGADDLFEEWSPTFREESLLKGLDAILKRIEFACGLAYGTLSDPQMIEKTATEIKTAKQRSYATIVDVQKSLTIALNDLLYAMDVWVSLGSLAPKGTYTATYQFDDSVLVDKEQEFAQDLLLVSSGLMNKWEFRVKHFNETEEIAKARIAEMQTQTPELYPAEE